MSPLFERILEQKRQRRQRLADLPFPEKIKIVEQLRAASHQIAAVGERHGLRKPVTSGPQPADEPAH
jgi:hypothetical protein